MTHPDEAQAELLDAYLNALQSGDRSRCQSLLTEHPELQQYADCLENLHDLTAQAETLPPQPRATPSPSSLMLGTQFGKYHLEAELGRGGMGIVYRARHVELHRKVALKMILHGPLASSDEVTRFLKEARAVAKLQHPHIVQVYEVGEQAGQHYLAMELLDGTSLERLLAEQKAKGTQLAPDEAVRFLLPLVNAVHFLHQQGILHRDLKPGNILLSSAQCSVPRTQANHLLKSTEHSALSTTIAKIADFGLAKSLLGDDGQGTVSGMIVGTPSYMAPEQAASRKGITPAADVYALGAILYELLTGQPPFKAATNLDTLVMVLESEPPQPRMLRPAIPRPLESIILKCLEKDPELRYPSAEALAADLQRFLAAEPVQAQPLSVWRSILHWTRREPALASHIGALIIFVAILQANYHLSRNVELRLHVYVLLLLGVWILLSFVLQSLLRRVNDPTKVACAWIAIDVLIYSLVLMVRGVETGPLIIGYPILIAMSGLWFRAAVIWFATLTTEIGVLTLLPYWHGWDYLRENPHHPLLVVVMLAVQGLVMAYQVERVRSLSRFYGSRGI
ncbi:MAG: serine/threonine-protein kinase [Gemmatales bacterium]